MELSYAVRAHGLPGYWRWYVEVRPAERRIEFPQQPLLADISQPTWQQAYVSQEAAERAGEEFLTQLAMSPPRA